MRRLLTFATLFASLLPLPSAAAEVSTQEVSDQAGLKTAWEDKYTSSSTITIASPIEIKGCSEAWNAGASSITLAGKTGAEQLYLSSSDIGQKAYAQMIAGANTEVSIKNLSLKNDDEVYLLQAASVTLNNVTIASSSEQSAAAAVNATNITLTGKLTLDLNTPCNTLLSCSGSLTCSTDFSGITINISNDFTFGDGGATNLILFTGTSPSTISDLKCTVNGPSGYYVVLRDLPGGKVLCLVPEPGSATLTLIGLIALLHRRRRPRSKGIHGGAFVRG